MVNRETRCALGVWRFVTSTFSRARAAPLGILIAPITSSEPSSSTGVTGLISNISRERGSRLKSRIYGLTLSTYTIRIALVEQKPKNALGIKRLRINDGNYFFARASCFLVLCLHTQTHTVLFNWYSGINDKIGTRSCFEHQSIYSYVRARANRYLYIFSRKNSIYEYLFLFV